MKLLVRVSVFGLVFAGALASSFTPKTHAASTFTPSVMVMSSAVPVPTCGPKSNFCN